MLHVHSVGLRSEETPLDMGFGTDPAHDLAHHLNIQPEETPLEMGFETLDPVHGLPYQSCRSYHAIKYHCYSFKFSHG